MHLTYRYRVKSLHGELGRQARAVNFVWNYCNDVQKQALKWGKKWPTGFDLNYLTAGTSKDLGLTSATVNAVCESYARSRRASRRPCLRYRGKRTLAWVPLKAPSIKREGDAFRVGGRTFRVFNSRPLPDGKIVDGGSFAQDALGRWHLNIVVEVPVASARQPAKAVGIDLGLKDLAALSTGEKIANPRHVAALADRLATAQRAGKRRQALKLHAKTAHARADYLHKASTRLVRDFDYIAVGNINAANLGKSNLAKAVFDAGWSSFRNMLRYKAMAHGAWYTEVNERFTTQACSCCGVIPASSPKGMGALGIRQWVCNECGASHDRDTNAARNLLARSGHRPPAEGAALSGCANTALRE